MYRNFYDVPKLESFERNGERFYKIPGTRNLAFPSVTTVIYRNHKFPDSPMMTQARNRGTAVHDLCEKYLLTGEVDKSAMPINLASFQKIKRKLDRNMSTVNIVEGCLYSEYLQTAGKVDCLGAWCDYPAVVDFKTSKKRKTIDQVENYFVQLGVYGFMAKHTYFWDKTYNDKDVALVLIIANDEDPEAQLFYGLLNQYKNKIERIFVEERPINDYIVTQH